MYSFILGVSANNHQVYTNVINSAAGRCFGRQPYLVSMAKGIVESLELREPIVRVTRNMGRTIGNTNIVATEDKELDLIYYARQLKQDNLSRFIKNRSMEPSSELSIILRQDIEGNYELTNAWIGPACPSFPGSADASEDSKAYWRTHALTSGSEPISSQSITRVPPY